MMGLTTSVVKVNFLAEALKTSVVEALVDFVVETRWGLVERLTTTTPGVLALTIATMTVTLT
jgi:hypothetical protein